jgi:quercetin dioxygenase-like cupin family protein
MKHDLGEQDADVVIRCAEFASAQSFYVDELGFRLDAIFPADAPRVALLSAHGITVRLQADDEPGSSGSQRAAPTPLVTRLGDNPRWGVGRAGMQYRDLIPGRQDGSLIASHIRIPSGGSVPDYVHYHKVDLQIIYCYTGNVRVVYEDQGPSFVMQPGDCVLQPPGIRHRVLECSDAFEVVEIGSPAEHETFVDHEMPLPTSRVRPEREFGGQRFVHHRAADAEWRPWQGGEFEARETGIATASGGFGSVEVLRKRHPVRETTVEHQPGTRFCFILQGSLALGLDGARELLQRCDSFVVPEGMPFSLSDCSDDLQVLLVAMRLRRGQSG